MKKRIRLDAYLYESRISESKERAKREIIAGWVKVDGETVRVPSHMLTGEEKIDLRRPRGIFASRGGEKLFFALKYFNISVKDKIVADIGAATGGFTDCLLQNEAKKVYSIDVGYGLLDYRLRVDPRVVVKERTDVKNLLKSDFKESIDFITIDLSLISILKVFDKIKNIFPLTEGIILIKPQYEANREELERGVVKDRRDHRCILRRVVSLLLDKEMHLKGLHFSPIKGASGNIEFLIYFQTCSSIPRIKVWKAIQILIDKTVDEAYKMI